MSNAYQKPLPHPDRESEGFWEGCKDHELRILRCNICDTYVHEPAPICHRCNAMDLSWQPVSGKGSVFTYAVVWAPTLPGFAEDVPYVVAWIELVEQPGLKLLSNVVGCEPKDVSVGMPVEVAFEDVTPDMTLHRFRPVHGRTG